MARVVSLCSVVVVVATRALATTPSQEHVNTANSTRVNQIMTGRGRTGAWPIKDVGRVLLQTVVVVMHSASGDSSAVVQHASVWLCKCARAPTPLIAYWRPTGTRALMFDGRLTVPLSFNRDLCFTRNAAPAPQAHARRGGLPTAKEHIFPLDK
jgi:hypothetical protein